MPIRDRAFTVYPLGVCSGLPGEPVRIEAQDEHAYIHEMMGDASVLSDRMDYDPAALAGIVGRLVNAVTILSDQNKALAARVAALESWQRSEETAALEASERD